MTESETVKLAGQELRPVTTTAFRGVYGTHTVDKGNISVWLDFEDSGLAAFSRWRPEPWKLKSIYISPKKNLCTGQLSFFLRLFPPNELAENARVYLDGKEIEHYPWAGPFEIPVGKHELRVEKEGYEPVVKHLEFEAEDRGEMWIEIASEELLPIPS